MKNTAVNDPNDVQVNLQLTIEETYLGTFKKIDYQRRASCGSCGGKKRQVLCFKCGGKGYVINDLSMELDIPAGVDEGMVMSFKEKGHQVIEKEKFKGLFKSYFNSGKRAYGNLNLHLEVMEHPNFSRDGYDLIVECPLRKAELSLGVNKEIQLPDKSTIRIKIPEDTQDGRTFRIMGKGFPLLNENKSGNLLIMVKISDP